jgi:hypothetical protein
MTSTSSVVRPRCTSTLSITTWKNSGLTSAKSCSMKEISRLTAFRQHPPGHHARFQSKSAGDKLSTMSDLFPNDGIFWPRSTAATGCKPAARLTLGGLLPSLASAQDAWPSKSVRFVVPFAPGGSSEIVARSTAAELSRTLGQSVFVDNKPGAAGNIAMSEVARATDQHTSSWATSARWRSTRTSSPSCPTTPTRTSSP